MLTTQRDTLKAQVETVQNATAKLLKDISEQDSLVTIGTYPNHIKWLTGHLAWTASVSIKVLGGRAALPDGWADLFRRGAPVPERTMTTPTFAETRDQLTLCHKKILEMIEASDDEKLSKVTEIAKGWEDSPMGAVLFFAAHEFYHDGQIAMIRREIGLTRTFG